MIRKRGIGQKPFDDRWAINYACPLVRQPLFICALVESAPDGKYVLAKGLKFNGEMTSVSGLGFPTRQYGNATVGTGANRVRHAPVWAFNEQGNDLRIPAQSADVLPAQGLTYVMVRHPNTTAINRGHTFGHLAAGGNAVRAGVHAPFTDGVVYWDYGGVTGANRLTWSGYTPATNMETWVFVAGARGSAIYFNGLQVASQGTAISRTQAAEAIGVNSGNATTTSNFVAVHMFAAFGSEWTESEVWSWSNNPYQLIWQNRPSNSQFYLSNTFNDSLSETASITDSISSVGDFGASLSESANAVETIATGAIVSSSIEEAATASDAYSSAADFVGAIAESANIIDVVSSSGGFHATISESSPSSDTYLASQAFTATVADVLTIGDFYGKPIPGPPAEQVTEGWWHYFNTDLIVWIGYDPSNELLEINFTDGSERTYSGVSFGIAQAFVTADDPDLYWGNAIRGRYTRVFAS